MPDSVASEDRLPLTSQDLNAERVAALKELFPDAVTEGKIDFERLKESLGESVAAGKERYELSWAGKSEAKRVLQSLSTGTLEPMRKESVNFDTSENLIIEGDNLEVLKLLQKSYQNKIKMIYIDPPYNTGNEFIYPDKFSEGLADYLVYSGQKDGEGFATSANRDTEGRYHSKWLSMMYPRLFLARNLLSDKGIIFISIDDNECSNLMYVLDEIFGSENRVGVFIWEKKRKASNLDKQVRSITEYILAYRRREVVPLVASEDVAEENKPYPFYNSGNKRGILNFPGNFVQTTLDDGRYKAGQYSDRKTTVTLLDDVIVENGIIVNDFRLEGEWRYSQKALSKFVSDGETIEIKGDRFKPYWINNNEREKFVKTLLDKKNYSVGTNEDGNQEISEIFSEAIIDFPKPVSLIQKLVEISNDKEGIFLDFFSGSGTTAHSVIMQNLLDEGNRKFILVQLPEQTGRTDYPTIADITRERVRRVIAKTKDEQGKRLFSGGGIIAPWISSFPTHRKRVQTLGYGKSLRRNGRTRQATSALCR